MSAPQFRVWVLTRPEHVGQFWDWLTTPGRQYVAFDTETTGLDVRASGFKCRMAQFGDSTGGWAIPFEGWPGLVFAALDWCAEARVPVVMHNCNYDVGVMRRVGYLMDFSNVQDTMVWAGLGGFAEQPRGLKPCAVANLGPWAGVGEKLLKTGMDNAGWDWATVPFGWQPYPMYGVVDTVATGMLYEKWADRRALWGKQHALEIAAVDITSEMSWTGLPVDLGYLSTKIGELYDEEHEIAQKLASVGISNPSQNASIKEYLQKKGILDESNLTPTGQVSVDADALKAIDDPAARAVVRWRFVHRVRGTYLEKMLAAAGGGVEGIGYIHPEIRPMEAKTSRMSVSNPPMQQMPRDDPIVRNGVVPREGDVMITGDFGQIEMRLWASMNKDEALLAAFKESDETGADFFVTVGRQLYNEPDFQKSDPRRNLIKNASYATIYVGGPDTIAATAGVPLAVAMPVIKALKNRFPSYADGGQSMFHYAGKTGPEAYVWSNTPTGRRFAVKDPKQRHKLSNYLVQGHSAEILKLAMVRLRAAGFGPHMLLPVHDEVLFSIPKNQAIEAQYEIGQVMNSIVDPDEYGISITTKPTAGTSWGDVKK